MNLLDIFFPRRCVGCGRLGQYFCPPCRLSIRSLTFLKCPECGRAAFGGIVHPRCQCEEGLDGLTSFFRYEGVVRKAIKQLKYRLVTDLAREFVSLAQIPDQVGDNITLIPIPLHPVRLRERGFNQAEVLGKLIADKLGVETKTDLLKRIRKTTPQAELTRRNDRLKNMDGVFAVSSKTSERVLLFDDVFTTGATLRAAAKVLKQTGAKSVWGMTIAQ